MYVLYSQRGILQNIAEDDLSWKSIHDDLRYDFRSFPQRGTDLATSLVHQR